jgi:hypothetical protein
MKIDVVTKARLGFAIAFGILVGIGEAQAIAHIDLIGNHAKLFCLLIAGLGVLSWFLGQYFKPFPTESSSIPNAEGETNMSRPPLFFDGLMYSGVILVIVSGIMFSLSLFHNREVHRHETVKVEPNVKPKVESPTVTFPPLELQGLILNGPKSSAMINGQVLFVGEGIGKVQLLAVDRQHATVGLEGQTKILTLRKE